MSELAADGAWNPHMVADWMSPAILCLGWWRRCATPQLLVGRGGNLEEEAVCEGEEPSPAPQLGWSRTWSHGHFPRPQAEASVWGGQRTSPESMQWRFSLHSVDKQTLYMKTAKTINKTVLWSGWDSFSCFYWVQQTCRTYFGGCFAFNHYNVFSAPVFICGLIHRKTERTACQVANLIIGEAELAIYLTRRDRLKDGVTSWPCGSAH